MSEEVAKDILRQAWEGYRAQCVPANAPDSQLAQTHLAFMGGAIVCFQMVCADKDEETMLKVFQSLENELRNFSATVAFHSGDKNAH
jgi:hypothetical protein